MYDGVGIRRYVRAIEYWRVTFDNPPFNIFGPETIPQLNAVITQIEKDPRVRVVVFDSARALEPRTGRIDRFDSRSAPGGRRS